MVRDFAESVLEADYAPVVSLFAEANTLSQEEIVELYAVLEAADEGAAP
jgi:predicted transcriptional regulator